MTVSALDVLTDRWENRLAVSRIVCVRVVLSFLVSEFGDDFSRTWPRAFQTLVVTNEQVAFLSQFLLQLPNGSPCVRKWLKFTDVTCCTTFCPDVCFHQRQPFGHTDSDAFSLFGFAFQVQVS